MGIPSPTLGTGAKEEEIVSDPEFRARSEDHEIFYRYVKERNDVSIICYFLQIISVNVP